MRINLILIDKKGKETLYTPLIEHYTKMIKQFAKVEVVEVFTKEIAKAQESSREVAQSAYTQALLKYIPKGYNVALHPASQEVDSFDFANLLKDRSEINLYIGGAYGFEKGFLSKCNRTISFGKITLSHKLVKLVALEQIYRGLAINHNHPYHK
jgi:23S rRNA (pseudouridine1915-N3)-methyltransferase